MTKCFDQLSHLKKFTVSHLNDEDFTSLLAHQNWTKYFKN